MAEIFCIKCKEKHLVNEELDYRIDGRAMLVSKCPKFGHKITRLCTRGELNALVKTKYTKMTEGEFDESQK